MNNWIIPSPQSQSSSLARGVFGIPVAKPVGDTVSVLATATATGQYLSISNAGPNSIFLRFGGDATSSVYNVLCPPGFNTYEVRIAAGENLTAICSTGETATVMVAIASEIKI